VLLDELDELGLLVGTNIILTADHGEALGESHLLSGMKAHFGNPSHEPVLQVPLIVAPPAGGDARRIVRTQDMFNLVREMTAPELPREGGDVEVDPDELYVGEQLYQTYRKGDWKSVRRRSDGAHFLFDLATDPDELRDLAPDRPDIVRVHQQRLDEIAWALATTRDHGGELTPQDRARLHALGYLE
jgi:arylsulfatase A-like enzyme